MGISGTHRQGGCSATVCLFTSASHRSGNLGIVDRSPSAGRSVSKVLGREAGEVAKRVLVVDDEPKIVEVVGDYLRRAGFAVTTASDGGGALDSARSRPPDLVVLDLGLPGLNGLDVARELQRTSPVPIIMLT